MSTTTATAAPISFSGISSGLDTTSIITELVAADQAPITQMQNQQTALQAQEGVYSQLSSDLQAFQTATAALNSKSTFNSISASSSNTAAATITTATGASAGNYNLSITQLAQAQKIVSSAQTDTTSALGLSGTIEINGKSTQIAGSQSLTAIAKAINSMNAGVTAGIVNGGTGNAYISMTSNSTGAAHQMELGDMNGSVLQSLGLTNGTTSVANPVTGGALSFALSSQSTNLQGIIGSEATGAIQINGKTVNVDFANDSLQSIVANINASGAGVTASVKASTDSNGVNSYQLQLVGTDGTAPTLTDDGNVLQSLGVLQQGVSNQLVKAQDASFTLDNATITSATNTVSTAIPGATITLLSGTTANPATTNISLTQSTSGVTDALNNFVSAYNTVADFISSESTINTSTFATGPLFGDTTAQQISSSLTSMLFQNVPGLTGPYTNLASLGMTLDQTGDLSLNTDTLNSALASSPTQVAQLFQATGSSTNPNINYVTSTSNSKASGSGGYALNVTQLATKSQFIAGTAQTSPASNAETLTFGGALLGNVSYNMILNIGATLQDTVDQINNDSKLGSLMTASINSNGALQLDSKVFGTPGAFSIQSNQAAAGDDSGIGTSVLTPTTVGLDIAGTINGETATGSGQFLTGASGNANTDGLELEYAGTQLGSVGTLNFSGGLAGQLNTLLGNFTNPITGLLQTATNGLQAQYTSLGTDITNQQAALAAETAQLTQEFNNMESAIGQLQAQSKSLDALLNAGSSSTSTGTSSSSNSNSSNGGGTVKSA